MRNPSGSIAIGSGMMKRHYRAESNNGGLEAYQEDFIAKGPNQFSPGSVMVN